MFKVTGHQELFSFPDFPIHTQHRIKGLSKFPITAIKKNLEHFNPNLTMCTSSSFFYLKKGNNHCKLTTVHYDTPLLILLLYYYL